MALYTKNLINDLVLLDEISEEAVSDTLSKRHKEDLIYTYIGSVLVSVNPFKPVGIYTDKYVNEYHGKYMHENPPHVFALSETAHQTLITEHHNQCIIITGEVMKSDFFFFFFFCVIIFFFVMFSLFFSCLKLSLPGNKSFYFNDPLFFIFYFWDVVLKSGSGKTEASKKIMQYIAAVSSGSAEIQRVKDQILKSNPILEAFGNAKTVRNNNSSRYR